jgi:hypothetical protein
MSSPIIAAIRQQRQLKESLLFTAQELAHRSSIYGLVPPTSYSFLAEKAHCSARTAIRHIHKLEEMGIVEPVRQKRIVRRKDLSPSDRQYSDDPQHAHERVIRNEINRYRFLIKWDKSSQRSASSTCLCDKTAWKLPPTEERGKPDGVRKELRNQEKWLHNCTPGSDAYLGATARIVYLRQLLGASGNC